MRSNRIGPTKNGGDEPLKANGWLLGSESIGHRIRRRRWLRVNDLWYHSVKSELFNPEPAATAVTKKIVALLTGYRSLTSIT